MNEWKKSLAPFRNDVYVVGVAVHTTLEALSRNSWVLLISAGQQCSFCEGVVYNILYYYNHYYYSIDTAATIYGILNFEVVQ